MSFTQREFSKVKIIDRQQDIIIDYVDDNHARLMKLFPVCHEIEPPDEITNYRRFHVRLYLPEKVFKDKKCRSKKCFIMLNGLDERFNYSLYDQIGKGLARSGYASVLLPLPNHLNRNIGFRSGKLNQIDQPSDSFITEPEKIIEAYKQVIGEIDILIHHIQHNCKYADDHECCSFFNRYFDHNTQVSVLGYSLGGLVALSYFLLRKNSLNSCIMLNSGAKLSQIDVSHFIEKEKWDKMVKSLSANRHTYANSDEKVWFEKIFLGLEEENIKDALAEQSNKILFILGGADSVTRRKGIMTIEPDHHGLAILQLPGIHHFVSSDIHWDQWFPIVLQTITSFDYSASQESLSANDIIDTLIEYHNKYGIIKDFIYFDKSILNNTYDLEKINRTFFAAKCIYGSIEKTLIQIYKLHKKYIRSTHLYPPSYGDFYNSLFSSTPPDEIESEIDLHIKALEIAEQSA